MRCKMNISATTQPWRTSLAWSAILRAAGLFIAGFIGWLWLPAADGAAWRPVALVALLALAALVGVAWHLGRARTERRWRAALDHYAEQELAKATCPRSAPSA